MKAIDICLCFLTVSGAFALISLGVLFIRIAGTLKEVNVLFPRVDETITKINSAIDDVNYKLDQLNAPVELINRTFSKRHTSGGILGFITKLLGLRKNK